MRHRLFTLATVLSLLLLLLTAAMWVRSYWRVDIIGWGRVDAGWGSSSTDLASRPSNPRPEVRHVRFLATDRGRALVGESRTQSEFFSGSIWWASTGLIYDTEAPNGQVVPREKSFLGFGHHADGSLQLGIWWSANAIPLWAIAALTAIAPLLWLRRWIRGRRLRRHPNLCTACGYDLTGNVSGRCPECGTDVRVDPSAV
jgi:hypothetical protein